MGYFSIKKWPKLKNPSTKSINPNKQEDFGFNFEKIRLIVHREGREEYLSDNLPKGIEEKSRRYKRSEEKQAG